MINISIDLMKIDKSKIIEGKNGAKYINITVDELKEAGKFGETHCVYISQSKAEREAKEKKTYIGQGKEFKFNSQPANTPQADEPIPSDNNVLPFNIN